MLNRFSALTCSCTFCSSDLSSVLEMVSLWLVVSRDGYSASTESGFGSSTGWKRPTLRSLWSPHLFCYISVPCDACGTGMMVSSASGVFCFTYDGLDATLCACLQEDSGDVVYENRNDILI